MEQKSVIIIVRHGEVYNPKNVVYGRLPGYKLSKKGKDQVVKLANKLKGKNISLNVIYSSPLERAVGTAEILKKLIGANKIEKREELTDIGGNFQGSPHSILEKANYDISKLVQMGYKIEAREKIITRLEKIFKEVKTNNKGKVVAIVTHGDPGRVLTWLIMKKDGVFPKNLFDSSYLGTAEAVILNLDENWKFKNSEFIRN